jgi:putative hemolysin
MVLDLIDRNFTASPNISPLPFADQSGVMAVRLATTPRERIAAQALRYQVFYEEMSATPTPKQSILRRDYDRFDAVCDHLILTINGTAEGVTAAARLETGETVIGCYRLLQGARARDGFYSAQEFDLTPLIEGVGRGLNILELGRSCIAPAYRSKHAIDRLWRGLYNYIQTHNVDVLMGCASFPTIDIDAIAEPLSFLHYNFSAPAPWRVRAQPAQFVAMDRLCRETLDDRKALRGLPPILRGYIRAGCMVGEGAVIDADFGTTDVFVLLPLQQAAERYIAHYS